MTNFLSEKMSVEFLKISKFQKILQKIEIIKGQISLASTSTGSNVQTVGSIEGIPVPNSDGNQFTIDGDNFGEVQSYSDQVYGFSPIGNYEEYDSSAAKYTFKITDADFSSSMVGGTITVSDPNEITTYVTARVK